MIQMWVKPEKAGEPAGYKLYDLQQGKITRVYGGPKDQDETFPSQTIMDIGLLNENQKIPLDGKFVAYVTKGGGIINEKKVSEGDLVQGHDQEFQSLENTQIIVASVENGEGEKQ